MGSKGPPPQPLTPAQPNVDVGYLINTLASGLHLGTLRINTFSREVMPGKTEVSFEQWYHEVQCVKDHYPESVVWESIVRSLKGAVADMAKYMGPTASVSNILQKLMVIMAPSPTFDHSNISGHSTTINNFTVVGREEQNLCRLIKESMFIRVSNPSLNKNIGKYHLPHIWDEVLVNNTELKLK